MLLVVVAVVALLLGAVLGGVSGRLVGGGSAQTGSVPGITPSQGSAAAPGSTQAAVATLVPSVVTLSGPTPPAGGFGALLGGGQEGEVGGSGMIISPDGLILTNNHVVAGAATGQLVARLSDGRVAPTQVVGTAPAADLAVIKAQGLSGLQPITFGDSNALVLGQPVVAVGAPLGLSGTVTEGIVSARDRPLDSAGDEGGPGQSSPGQGAGGADQTTVLDAVQTDASINPGNSGGPLANDAGQVVGVNTAINSPSSGSGQAGSVGLGFAIPSNQAQRIANELVSTGRATQATLGVQVGVTSDPITPGKGASIQTVEPGGPAAAAGLQPGQVVSKLNDRVIDTGDALVAAVHSTPPNTPVTLTVGPIGDPSDHPVPVTLGSQIIGGR